MTVHRHSRLLRRRVARAFRRCVKDKRGIAAVEFAMILPLMLLMYIGTAQLTNGVMASRKSSIVARSLSDLVAQQPSGTNLTDSQLVSIFGAAGAIMSPFPATSAELKMTVSSVEFMGTGGAATTQPDGKVRWSVSQNSGTKRPCQKMTVAANGSTPSSTTLPTGIYPSNSTTGTSLGSVIVSDVVYTFNVPFGGEFLAWTDKAISGDATATGKSFLTFKNTTYMRPRTTAVIAYTAGTGTVCTSY